MAKDPTDNPAIKAGIVAGMIRRGEIDKEEGEMLVNELADQAKEEGLYE